MKSRTSLGSRPRRRVRPVLGVERLEDRWLPTILSFTAPSGNGLDDMVLRKNGSNIELVDNQALVRSVALNGLTAVQITGASGEDDRLTVDYNAGGLFAIPSGISFSNASGVAGVDTLLIKGTTGADAISLSLGQVSVQNASVVSFSGVEQLQINGLGGDDTITATAPLMGPAVSVDGGTGTNTLVVNGLSITDTFIVANGQVTVDTAPITFTNIAKLQVNTLGGDDNVTINAGTPGTLIAVVCGSGKDSVVVNNPSGSLSVDGTGGAPTLVVNGTSGADNVTLTTGQVTMNNGTISFVNVAQLRVSTLAGNDKVTVNGTTPGTAVSLDGGADNDTLVVNGTNGSDNLVLTIGQLTLNGSAIGIAFFETIQINTLAGDDTVTVNGPLANGTVLVNGGPGKDTLVLSATNQADAATLSTGQLVLDGIVYGFTNIENLQLNLLGGPDTFTLAGTNPGVAIVVDAGPETDDDRSNFTFKGDFSDNLTLLHFHNVQGHTNGNFSGQWTVLGSGTINDLTIGGSVTQSGMIMTEDITDLTVMGSVDGTVIAHGSGTIDNMTVGSVGSTGMIMSEDITNLTVMGTDNGQIIASGSGTIGDLDVGSVGSNGKIVSEDITTLTVMGDMAGTVQVMKTPDSNGNLQTMTVSGNLTGSVSVDGDLNQLVVTGNTLGTIAGGDVGTVSAKGGVAGSPVLRITEAGVLRDLVTTRVDNRLPTPSSIVFDYFYDSTGPGNPQLSVKVTNGSPGTSADDVRFDLRLTSSTTAGFDLARLFGNGTADVRDVTVAGNLLPAVSSLALAHFGLPAGTPGGVRLPGEALAAVTVQGNVVAGTVQVGSAEAVAFGSITKNGITTLAESATNADAAGLLAAGTTIVLANDPFVVPFAEGRPVALFLSTAGGGFDPNDVLFTDQLADNLPVTALVTTVSGGITSIQLVGNGGSIQTALPVGGPITSTGPLGDLTLSSSANVGDVTAPSILGSITTKGTIAGTIQTTSGDLGQTLNNGMSTTTITTTQGITGRIISRGSLVSQITAQQAFSGVIAAQGDFGAGSVSAGQLTRLGGFQCGGSFTGSVVVLGNLLGDIVAQSGLAGRIAAKGHAIAGLAATRFGILGNITVTGTITSTAAIVSAGVIGDAAAGTSLSAGAIQGILAAEQGINLGTVGDTSAAHIYNPAIGVNADAIDAIFTYNNGVPLSFDLTSLDLAGLNLILTDLAALSVGQDGNLTGPVK